MGGKRKVSYLYDDYLVRHKSNVKKGYEWIQENLPELLAGSFDYEWQIMFSHDDSKYSPDEYEAYDKYFYGGNKSYSVVQNFRKAWLLHIHRNPHHWQHWVLINDDPKEGEIILEMPYNYIIEMICDWWAFSWSKGNLTEIFDWYAEHAEYMKLALDTRKEVENILNKIQDKLEKNNNSELIHYGVKGMKWGVRNGPPYPLDKSKKRDTIVLDAIRSGKVSKTINPAKQMRHTRTHHLPGRSYLDGDLKFAQDLIDQYFGTGNPIVVNGKWTNRERITADIDIGLYVDIYGNETRSNKAIIIYSKTGTHIYPVRKEDKDEI